MSITRDDYRNTTHWFAVALICLSLVMVALAIYPLTNPEDEGGLARSLLLRSATMMVGGLWLLLNIVLLDYLTPGQNLRDIASDTKAIAAVFCSYILSLGFIFMYS